MLTALYYSAYAISLALVPVSIVNAVEAPYKTRAKNSIAFVSYTAVLVLSICSVYFFDHQFKELNNKPQYEVLCIVAFALSLILRYTTYKLRIHKRKNLSHDYF